MNWLHAVILGIVEGITEFLPVSSTGHLNIVEKLLGYQIDDKGMTAFTAIIQIGAILAAVVYFWSDIVRIVVAWFKGLASKDARKDPDYTLGWGIILGSIPVAAVGLLLKNFIEVTARSMWVIAGALIIWSAVMWFADEHSTGKGMSEVKVKDALIIGSFQALAPVLPGISRSGATISAGLFLRFDRVTATRLSFFMGIPALIAAGLLEAVTAAEDISSPQIGWTATIIATMVSGVVAYATIAWLLKFVSSNKFTDFLLYRVALGVIIIVLVATGTIAA